MRYIDKLTRNCEEAKNAMPLNEFVLSQTKELDSVKQAIYIIEEIDGNIEKTFKEFSDFKAKQERKCAKLNAPSKVMYVGSSTTDIKKRILQHLGEGHKSTHALHLSHWFKGNYKIIIKEYNESTEVLQIIEDDLSDSLKPAFGKQVGNNK